MKTVNKIVILLAWLNTTFIRIFLQKFLLLLCKILFRVKFNGLENIPLHSPFILVSNHQSYLDCVLLGLAVKRKLAFIMRYSIYKKAEKFLSPVPCIPVITEAETSAEKEFNRNSLLIAESALKQGIPLCIFPEGKRTLDGELQQIHAGFAILHKKTFKPIVPVYISGAFDCWPSDKKVFGLGNISVNFGKPIKVNKEQTVSELITKIELDLTRLNPKKLIKLI